MTTPVLKFSTTSKGKPLLIYDGQSYTLNQDRPNIKYWWCQERTCSACVHTDKNGNFKARTGDHNHLATPEHIELVELRHNVKRRVLEEFTPIAMIYEQEMAAARLTLPALSIAPNSKEARMFISPN